MSYCSKCGLELNASGTCPACQQQPQPVPQYQAPVTAMSDAYPQFAAPSAIKPTGARFFCEYILGLIPAGILVFTSVALFFSHPNASSVMGIQNLLSGIWMFLPLLLGAALTIRARGLDLSLAYMAAFAGILFASTGSAVIAILVALMFGAFNAALVVYLKLPSLIATLVVGQLIYGINIIATQSRVIPLERIFEFKIVAPFAALLLLAGTFVYNMLTGLGKPKEARPKSGAGVLTEFFAYPAAALCAATAGILSVMRMGAATPFMGSGWIIYLFVIWGALNASKWFSGKYTPIICAALVGLFVRMLEQGLAFLAAPMEFQTVIQSTIAMLFILAAGIAKWPFKKDSE